DKAIECFQRTLELDPNFPQAHFDLGLTLLFLQRYDDAIASVKRAVELSGGRTLWLAVLGWAYGTAGRQEEAEAMLHQVEELSHRKHVSSYEFGLLYLGLGDIERAIDYFEKAYEERSSLVLYLGVDPNVRGTLAEHPRIKAIIRKLKLD
ncbi:MAG: tetratricopeptide repeat protein, partial [Gemmatimonadetes bacterium]|nr:tetratricopeptide repeat protein [Gemmatimonadota bacterium]